MAKFVSGEATKAKERSGGSLKPPAIQALANLGSIVGYYLVHISECNDSCGET